MIRRFKQVGVSGKELTDMTTFAPTRNVLMHREEKSCRRKNTSGVVADTAIILSRDVIDFLGSCDARVMAGCAIVGIYTQVVEGNSREGRKVVDNVTRRTIQGCRHMVGGLSDTDPAIMAKSTVVGVDTHVIECRTDEVRRVVAHDAILDSR